MPGAADSDLIALAAREHLLLITEDKDFGWLVFASHAQSAGVILIRFPGNAREILVETIDKLIRGEAEKLADSFTVVQPGQVRISRRPDLAGA
jgi:predicted nuclease of predicted toxin-antitoxin system